MSSSRPRSAADGGATARHLRMDDAGDAHLSSPPAGGDDAAARSRGVQQHNSQMLKKLFRHLRQQQNNSSSQAPPPSRRSRSTQDTDHSAAHADSSGGRGGRSSTRRHARSRALVMNIAKQVLASKQAHEQIPRGAASRSSASPLPAVAPPSAPFASKDMANILLGDRSAATQDSPASTSGSTKAGQKRHKAGTRAELSAQVEELQQQLHDAQRRLQVTSAQNEQLSQTLRVAAQSLHSSSGALSSPQACADSLRSAAENAMALTAGVARDAFSAGFAAGLYTVHVLVDAGALSAAAAAAITAPGGSSAKRARRELHAAGVLPQAASASAPAQSAAPPVQAAGAGAAPSSTAQLEAEAVAILQEAPRVGGIKRLREIPRETHEAGCATCRLVFGHNPVHSSSSDGAAGAAPPLDSTAVLDALQSWPTALQDPHQWVRTVRAVVGPTPPASLAAAAQNPQALQLAAGAAAAAFMSASNSWCGGRSGTALRETIAQASGDLRIMRGFGEGAEGM